MFNLDKITKKAEQIIPKNLIMGIIATFSTFSAQAQEKYQIDFGSIEQKVQTMTQEQRKEYVLGLYSKIKMIESDNIYGELIDTTTGKECIARVQPDGGYSMVLTQYDFDSTKTDQTAAGDFYGEDIYLADRDADGDLDMIKVFTAHKDDQGNPIPSSPKYYDLQELTIKEGTELAKEIEVLNKKYTSALEVLFKSQIK